MKLKKLIATCLFALTCSNSIFSQEKSNPQDDSTKKFAESLLKKVDNLYDLKENLEPLDEKVDMAEKYIEEVLANATDHGHLEVYLAVLPLELVLETEEGIKLDTPKDAFLISSNQLAEKVFGFYFLSLLSFQDEAYSNFMSSFMTEFEGKLISRFKKYADGPLRFAKVESLSLYRNIYKFTLVPTYIEAYNKCHSSGNSNSSLDFSDSE